MDKLGARVLVARSARPVHTPVFQYSTPHPPPFHLGLLQFSVGEFEGDNHPPKRYSREGEKFLKNGKCFEFRKPRYEHAQAYLKECPCGPSGRGTKGFFKVC